MRLLILGTGGMAKAHIEQFSKIAGVEIVGGVDVNEQNLDSFCRQFGIKNRFLSLGEALNWGQFDAIANVTPDSAHYETTMKALKAGKHVFCEKPLATNYAHAKEMSDFAKDNNLIGMVNLTYRNVAHLHKARQMVLSGEIGEVKHFEASYLQSWLVQPKWGQWDKEHQWLWRLSKAHGSNGVLGDVGIHIIDFLSFGAGIELDEVDCRLKVFNKAPNNKIGEYKLDANDSFVISASAKNGAIGTIHASRFAAGHINDLLLRIWGDRGGIELIHRPDKTSLRASLGDDLQQGKWQNIEAKTVKTNYQRFVEAVKSNKQLEPSFEHGANLQKILDISAANEIDK